MKPEFVYLASASPRRRQLLHQLGLAVRSCPPHIDETRHAGENAAAYVQRLAAAKVRAAVPVPCLPPAPVIAADTAVVVDGEILGKPVDAASGCAMLARLSGREHEVWTAVAVADDRNCELALSRSRVRFRTISSGEAAAYWASGEPRDKAGGYAIQGLGAVFVCDLSGSYSGVMGLPLFETAQLLARLGWSILEQTA